MRAPFAPLIVTIMVLLPSVLRAGTWTKRNVSMPRPEGLPAAEEWRPSFAKLVYDSRRGVTVALGGSLYTPFRLTVSEYNGASWVSRFNPIASNPSNRTAFAAAFDSKRGVTVVYGGYFPDSRQMTGELWEYDGSSWLQRTWQGVAPPLSGSPKMCFDSVRGRTICLINFYPQRRSETWEWTGESWERGPDLREESPNATEIVFDEGRNRAFVYTANEDELEMVWEYLPGVSATSSVWQQVPISAPPTHGLDGVSLVCDYHQQRVLRHGGRSLINIYDYLWTTKAWDPVNSKWHSTGAPGNTSTDNRSAAGICYDRRRAVTVLFGGGQILSENGNNLQQIRHTDTWEFSDPAPEDRWVDFNYAGAETGSPSQPWNTLNEALGAAPANGIVWLKGTNTPATLNSAAIRSQPVKLRAWDGPVTLGR